MLPIPFFGARVEGDVARGGVGVFAELADAGIRIFPEHLVFARVDGVADFVGVVVEQRGAGINRPAAIVYAGVFLGEILKPAWFDGVFAPAQLIDQIFERVIVQRYGFHARGQRRVEPERQTFVEDRVDRAFADRLHAPFVAGPA